MANSKTGVDESQVELDAVEEKRQRKAAKRAATEAAAEVEAKRIRKAAKLAAREAAEAEGEAAPAPVDEAEAKRLRKEAKRAAKAAAATDAEIAGPTASKEVADMSADTAAEAERKLKNQRYKLNKAKREGTVPADLPAPAKKSKQPTAEEGPKTKEHKFGDDFKVFVRGLPWSVDEDALRKRFQECGEIEDLKMPRNASGTSRGVGFIKFGTEAGFSAALKLDNGECDGRTMNVAAVEKRDGGKGKVGKGKVGEGLTALVLGLPYSTTEALLLKDFGECGEIEKITLPMNPEGKPKGICFIKFKAQEGVDAALKFDNTDYGGRTIKVSKAADDGKGKGKSKGKGKEGKGKDGKEDKGKGKGKAKGVTNAPAFAGKKEVFEDSDSE